MLDITYRTENGLIAGCSKVLDTTIKFKGYGGVYALQIIEDKGRVDIVMYYPENESITLESVDVLGA